MAEVTKPVALNESLNTTDSTPKNIADVLKDKLGDIANAISGGGGGSGQNARKADLTNLDLTGTTNTTGSTITNGTYFYLNGTLVRAKTAIASGETFTLNTNYEVVTAGGLNELNNSKMSKDGSNVIRASVGSGTTILNYVKSGGSGLYILYTQNAEDSPTKGIVSYTWVHYVSSSYIYLRCFLGDSIYYALCGSNTSSISWTKIV